MSLVYNTIIHTAQTQQFPKNPFAPSVKVASVVSVLPSDLQNTGPKEP